MAFDIRGIKYVVTGDNASVDAANDRSAAGMVRLGKQADATGVAMLRFGKNGEVTARQLQALSYQTTDIITQLASGQSAWLVLLQQGGQLRDQFGGFGNLFKGIAASFTLTRVAALGLGGAVAALVAGVVQGYQESAEFRKQLALSGNAAGLTAGRVDELSANLAKLSGNTTGRAREAVVELAKSGFTVSGAMESAGRAALVMQRLTGESIDDITKRFAGARDGVARWAADANRAYNYLTVAQYEQIRTLEAQGKVQEAAKLNFNALADTLNTRLTPAVSKVDLAFQGWGAQLSAIWNQIKDLGRDETLEEKLAKLSKAINRDSTNPYYRRFTLPGQLNEQANLQKQLDMQKAGAERQARQAAEEQEAILKRSKEYLDAQGNLTRAGTQRALAIEQAAFDARAYLADRKYRELEIGAGEFRDRMIAIENGRISAERAALDADLQRARSRSVGSPTEVLARDTEVLGIETRIVAVEAKRLQINREIADFKRAVAPDRPLSAEALRVIAEETRGYEELAKRDADILQDRLRARQDLQGAIRSLGIEEIQDDRARGQAQLAQEEQMLRDRLSLWGVNADDRKAIENELVEWRRRRETQLDRQTMPEWRRRLEADRDPKKIYDDFMAATTQGGQDAWRAFLTDGQSFAKAMKKTIEQELATIGWKKYLADPFATLMQYIGNALGVGLGGAVNLGTATGGDLSLFHAGHTGGVVGAGMGGGAMRAVNPLVFAGARRYHTGGLASNEVPAILQAGEEVLTRGNPRHRANGGGGMTQVNNFYVPVGESPAAYASRMGQVVQQLRGELYADLSRPGRPLYEARR